MKEIKVNKIMKDDFLQHIEEKYFKGNENKEELELSQNVIMILTTSFSKEYVGSARDYLCKKYNIKRLKVMRPTWMQRK